MEAMADLSELEGVGRLALAALLGGVLGMEREYDGQDAGFRTHMLVVLGAALFGLVSVGAFDDYVVPQAQSNVTVDITRIAAYVAPGVGFIGGGAILKHGGRVSGVTTAASLWTAAAIGVASGLGAWESAVAATAIALVTLEGLRPVSRFLDRHSRQRRAPLRIEVDRGADLAAIMDAVASWGGVDVKRIAFGEGPEEVGEVTADFWTRPGHDELARLAEQLRDQSGVRSVTYDAI